MIGTGHIRNYPAGQQQGQGGMRLPTNHQMTDHAAPFEAEFRPSRIPESVFMPTKTKTVAKSAKQKTEAVASRDVVELLHEKIRAGRLVPGQRLVEADIVRETGASRSKVREALKRLESEGLVNIEEFRGASVRQLSLDKVHQIYKARMALEGMAAGEFARSRNKAQKMQLQKLQRAMNALETTGDHASFAQINDAWHKLIIDGSGNTYAAQFLSQLSVPVYRLLFSSFYSAQRIDRANADHKVITKAIFEGKADAAEKSMRKHINDGFAALLEIRVKLHI